MVSIIIDDNAQIIEQAKNVLKNEAQCIWDAIPTIDESFIKAIQLLMSTKGRIIVTGMGKPGYIAHKISATFASTGSPSFYIHPAEAVHGDLGMVTPLDIMMILSNSGETPEIIAILPTLKRIGLPIISICGNADSTLVAHSNVFLNSAVKQESCCLNLAPTNSTTLSLALGDAVAVVLMNMKKIKKEDFAFCHPGGSLGKLLLTKVKDIMKSGNFCCAIRQESSILNSLLAMTSCQTGAASVVNSQSELIGIVTDGDIRRYITHKNLSLEAPISDVMTNSPTWVYENDLIEDAIKIMKKHHPLPITVLPVLNRNMKVVGIINISDILKCHF